jgi:hypothetical protein
MDINLSTIKALPFDFETEVKNFIQAKKDHQNTKDVMAPAHHPLVEMAVRRVSNGVNERDDFVADYTIVDDTPPPPTLDEKKAMLADEVMRNANVLASQIIPPLKRKLFDFQISDAYAAISRAKASGQEPSDADKATIAEHETRTAKIDAVYRHVAALESQIHDLTEDQIDVWQGAPFPDVSA